MESMTVTNLSVVIFLECLGCIGNTVTFLISYLPVHIFLEVVQLTVNY